MSKSRREQFEDQLRALQDDISQLSRRLGNPVPEGAVSHCTSAQSAISSAHKKNTSSEKLPGKRKGENARLVKEKRMVERERDELVFKVEQLHRENTELRQSLVDFQRIKSLFEHLKQDHDSLLISLQSSERIRRQQKELIQIIQKNGVGGDLSLDSTFALSSHAGESCVEGSFVSSQVRPIESSSQIDYESDSAVRSKTVTPRSTSKITGKPNKYSAKASVNSQASSVSKVRNINGRPPRGPRLASSKELSRASVPTSRPMSQEHVRPLIKTTLKARPKTVSTGQSPAVGVSAVKRSTKMNSTTALNLSRKSKF